MVRDKYVPQALSLYQNAARAFYKEKDRMKAKTLLGRSIIRNPLNYEAWRLLGVLYFKPSLVESIRKIKRIVKGS